MQDRTAAQLAGDRQERSVNIERQDRTNNTVRQDRTAARLAGDRQERSVNIEQTEDDK